MRFTLHVWGTLLTVICGCGGAGSPSLHRYRVPYPLHAKDSGSTEHRWFTLESVAPRNHHWEVNGRAVRQWVPVWGLLDDKGNYIIPPESDEIVLDWHGVAYARRHGDATFTRYWLDGSGRKEPTDINQIRRFRGPRSYGIVGKLDMGDPAKGNIPGNTPVTVVVFAEDGSELFRLPRVERADCIRSPMCIETEAWPVVAIPGGFIAHHVADDGPFDLVYDERGNALSPPLPRLRQLPLGYSRVHFFPTVDGLSWPVDHMGEPRTLPAGIVGVIPLTKRTSAHAVNPMNDRVVSWLVRRDGNAGQRWTVYDDLAALERGEPGLEGLEFDDVQTLDDSKRRFPDSVYAYPRFAGRRVGRSSYEGFALMPTSKEQDHYAPVPVTGELAS